MIRDSPAQIARQAFGIAMDETLETLGSEHDFSHRNGAEHVRVGIYLNDCRD